MKYVDTRGIDKRELTACEVVLEGTTESGGLWVPKEIPKFTRDEISILKGESLEHVMIVFLDKFGFIGDDAIPMRDAAVLVHEAYENFRHENRLELNQLDVHRNFMLDLSFGPTFSFKDYALAIVGKIIPYILKQKGLKGVVLGATSGDTGPAAMANVASEELFVNILYPHDGTSEGQEQQMIHFSGDVAQAYAMEGMTFDDCQSLVKECFNDPVFMVELEESNIKLISINSINWLRIMAQAAYMCYVSLDPKLEDLYLAPNIVIPSGNSGHWVGAWIAKQMGANIGYITLATNKNDILSEVVNEGNYWPIDAVKTLAPAMDIAVSSNFERAMYFMFGSKVTKKYMIDEKGSFSLTCSQLSKLQDNVSVYIVVDDMIKKIIFEVYKMFSLIIDPHTATAFKYYMNHGNTSGANILVSTAHPMKFMDTITDVLGSDIEKEIVDSLPKQVRENLAMSQEEMNQRRQIRNFDLKQLQEVLLES